MRKHFPRHFMGMLMAVSTFASTLAASPNVLMTFVHPERFSDFRIQGRNEWDSSVKFAREMTDLLGPTVAQQAPGCTLTFRFTDIDLGGRYEHNRVNLSNVRFYNNGRLPIRFYFDYTLTDPRGRVLASGSDSAVDTLYAGYNPSEPAKLAHEEFYFEKETLIYWIKAKIHAPQAGVSSEGKR